VNQEEELIPNPAAFRHCILEADIRKAFEQRVFDHAMPGEEHKNLLLGFDRNGNPLEILYNVRGDDTINVFHAMKCRKAYRVFLDL
jgi:hypothetical protein